MADYPVNPKDFGGANVNWNEVKSAKITKNKNGQKTYTIVFKTGVTAQYPVQKGGASIQSRELTMWQSIDNDTETVANGFEGLQLKGSEKDDYIIGRNLKNSKIDVANDKGNDDHVVLESLSQHKPDYTFWQCNEGVSVKLDENDTLDKRHVHEESNGKGDISTTVENYRIKGPGIEAR